MKTRIYYQDTDAGGVIYHSRYLDFLERARADWFRYLGFESGKLAKEFNVLLVVRKLSIDFHQPGRLDDELDISVDTVKVGRAQLTLTQSVCRSGLILASANVNLACIHSLKFAPIRFPYSLKDRLEPYV
ncbi:MAG: YbgC/FadM family acyl-CoA thioesterase [Betaproteobacteria bacterium]|nr:YbgC/FadM family acyl-CoA thioesterase [Betaproteobacteria bacterium]MDC3408606.1 acyl-CoA thioesterase [Burkholderiales bacterium]MBT5670684.1 YbgC/FadM family acyl-CoA thioesterase [Betaproteobacteria bacterium]MBT6184542.1 YbgC/FadM family acyl-CoA thioesterase [Betaproteobacteria bacterium]MBT6530930.1 YbgC/FadM family acyl-CoA thioesterase [Betaproteobacteria bacterium]